MNFNQATLPARDLQASVSFYEALGLILVVRTEDYARFELPDGEATLSLSRVEATEVNSASGIHIYFECEDLDARYAALTAKGMAFESAPEDKRWLWREAWMRDPSGNSICLYWAGKNRKNPPWRIEG
ncbi:VOC family protein [Aestuariivirga sp.]|uniref:VOC family protein n=1 Tax=Aestuariivirga sp. TaxID=2650926 RepID=UPI0039E4EAF0